MTDSEDIYDVATRPPGHMLCTYCGAVFPDWEIEVTGDDEIEGWSDFDTCPSCNQPIVGIPG